jgi:glycosyltransferase involved in cell wall biosynthesis
VIPLVSILIPAFNAEPFIAETLHSAIQQTWPRKEIIVVDDSSTDQTASIARQFAAKDVLVVTQPNQGAAAARNRAYSLSQGDFLQWLDADDLLARDKITKQMEVLQSCDSKRTLASSSWARFTHRLDRAVFSPSSLWRDLTPVEWLLNKLTEDSYMQTGTWLVTRKLTDAAGPWDTGQLSNDDGEYFCRVILASDRIRFVPDAKMYYRMSGVSGLSYIGNSNAKLDAQFFAIQQQINGLRSLEESDRVRKVCLSFLQRTLIHFYPERLDLVARLKELARELKGELEEPKLPWKYAWIQKLFGWAAAKQAQLQYNQYKSSALRFWDKMLFARQATGPR